MRVLNSWNSRSRRPARWAVCASVYAFSASRYSMTFGSSRSRSQYQSSSRTSPCISSFFGRRSASGGWGCCTGRKLASAVVAVYALGDRVPRIDPTAYVHPDAVVIGDVVLGAESSVWPGAVLRGDYGHISVGDRTSVQDGTVVH